MEVVSDQAALLGAAYTNRSNRFSVGLQLRPTLRYAYEGRFASSELTDKDAMKERMQADANKSQGVGIDVGMIYTFADFWYPTFGLAVLNLPTGCREGYLNPFTEKRETVCGNVYSGDFGNEDALSTVDPTDIRAGVAITPRLTRKVNLRFSIDAHHIAVPVGDSVYGLSGIEAGYRQVNSSYENLQGSQRRY